MRSRCLSSKIAFFLLAVALLTAASPSQAQFGPVYWRDAQSPFTPGDGAIAGGPGSDPTPNSPMYICRARFEGSNTPGKWVKGNCNIAFGGKEQVMNRYQIAYGDAVWQPYSSTAYGLVRAGNDRDGTPLYSCRVRYNPGPIAGGDQGYQPGKLLNGTCRIPFGGSELVINPPFDALYAPGSNPYPPPYPPPGPPTPSYPTPDASSVSWQAAHSGDTPGAGAIEGGPGNGPQPDAPLYVCRAAGTNGGLFPGKWLQGKCSIAFNGGDYKQGKYDVAYGSARWAPFGGMITPDMVQGGFDLDQTPLYICRVLHFKMGFGSDKGNQPGYLKNNTCFVGYGSTFPTNPPFEALYNAPPSDGSNGGGSTTNGIIVSFDSGTGASSGTLTVTNGSNGKTVSRQLPPNQNADQCLAILQQAALDAGLPIQTDPKGLKLAGANNTVQVSGANVTMTPY